LSYAVFERYSIFSARQHTAYLLSALIHYSSSVCLSHWWMTDQAKTIEVSIMKFSLYGSPISSFAG